MHKTDASVINNLNERWDLLWCVRQWFLYVEVGILCYTSSNESVWLQKLPCITNMSDTYTKLVPLCSTFGPLSNELNSTSQAPLLPDIAYMTSSVVIHFLSDKLTLTYRIHSNRCSCPNGRSPPPPAFINLLAHANRCNRSFLYKKYMDFRSDFGPIFIHQLHVSALSALLLEWIPYNLSNSGALRADRMVNTMVPVLTGM